MTTAVLFKLLAIYIVVALGWWAGRRRWLDDQADVRAPSRILANTAFLVFTPALLFRTTARVDFTTLPWHTLSAFFLPVVLQLLAVYTWHRARAATADPAARPSVRAITVSFGNTVQIGIPMAAAVFGEAGLSLHITVVTLHALTLLTLLTLLVELDLARAHARAHDGVPAAVWSTLANTARNTIVHPVVLPVLAGITWNLTGQPLPIVLDEVLKTLGSAVVPLCLTLIGLSLACYGWPRQWRGVLALILMKLAIQPAIVLAVAWWGFHLRGQPLAVIVMISALPVGSNALLFAQRYRTDEAETTAAIVGSSVLFVVAAPAWLLILGSLPPR